MLLFSSAVKMYGRVYINSLSANVVYTRHDADVALAPRTGKIIKNGLNVFERGENLLQNGIQWILSISNSQGTNKFVRDRENYRKNRNFY